GRAHRQPRSAHLGPRFQRAVATDPGVGSDRGARHAQHGTGRAHGSPGGDPRRVGCRTAVAPTRYGFMQTATSRAEPTGHEICQAGPLAFTVACTTGPELRHIAEVTTSPAAHELLQPPMQLSA